MNHENGMEPLDQLEQFKRLLIGAPAAGDIPDGLLNGWNTQVPNMLTMIGYKRLTNLEVLITDIVANNVDGDVIETGVWRGGACIFMRKILNSLGSNKVVYAADSFCGLPAPDAKYPVDKEDRHHAVPLLSVSKADVIANFARYDLLAGVVFVEGWFKDTLPKLDNRFSLIRLDGDMYESTWDALVNLYPKLSIGGFCVVDDYGVVTGCNAAAQDYRGKIGIRDEIIQIDRSSVYWRKTQ